MKLGSLFDGSGGFPLAGALFGIEPVWASEIEPFPIRVTKQRFPSMKHLGSVTEVKGDQVEPVDIITFGSPCQDLSMAGKRAGIYEGQRSNLFFESTRIIEEMRNATANKYPRFAVWENVLGAFSSNEGRDFQAVLQAFVSICDPGLYVPRPPDGAWQPAGCVLGNGFSIAWRVYNAEYWGVPHKRQRIYLVADFKSERAEQILFKPESECWNSGENTARAARYVDGCSGRSWWSEEAGIENTEDLQIISFTQGSYTSLSMDSKASTLMARDYKQAQAVLIPQKDGFILRRMTPTEYGRLQGFPDWWVDGTNGKDAEIYKMWGNGVNLPCVADVIGRLAKVLDT